MGRLDICMVRGWSSSRILSEIRDRDEMMHRLMYEELDRFDSRGTLGDLDNPQNWDEWENEILNLKSEIDLLTSLL